MLEVYADLWCPFAHVGLRTAAKLRDELSPGTALLIRAWPLELMNGQALNADKTAGNVEALRNAVAPELFQNFKTRVMPASTIQGLALIEAANDKDPVLGERIGLGLRNLLFEHGVKIDNLELLRGIARQNGLDPSVVDDHALVKRRWEEGRSKGVVGSPHFFSDHADLFCPLLEISRDEMSSLHISRNSERMSEFLSKAFIAEI